MLVLEKAPNPHSPLKGPPFGLRGLTSPTTDSLDRRDLLNALTSSTTVSATLGAHWMLQQQRRPGGHFAGIQFFHDRVDTTEWPYRLPGTVSNIATDMASIETVLAARAHALNVETRHGCGFESFELSHEGVTVRAGSDMFRGSWLIGCDGGRSIVRRSAGIGFTGTDPEFTGYSVQAVLEDTGALKPGRHYTATGMYTYAAPGTIAMVDFDGGAFHRTDPITREHVEAVLRKVTGTNIAVTSIELAATWTDRAFQATEYRKGRVLLAGDAAHTHSPLGGQGLNLGLGDAMNLGWKLAAIIHGNAPSNLLDSYERERQPIGAQILDWPRAQVALMRPNGGSRALEAVIRDLIETRDGATYFAERVWGIGLRHDLGAAHPLVGRSAPNFALADGTRLNEHFRDGRGLLLDFENRAPLRTLADYWLDRINFVEGDAREKLGVSALLARPDGVVAWASDVAAGEDDAAQAVLQWFGPRKSLADQPGLMSASETLDGQLE